MGEDGGSSDGSVKGDLFVESGAFPSLTAMTDFKTEQDPFRTISWSVKLIPPEVGRYCVRQALMKKLSQLLVSPGKIWISSPRGREKPPGRLPGS